MVYVFSPGSQEAGAGEPWSTKRVLGQPGLCGAIDRKAQIAPADLPVLPCWARSQRQDVWERPSMCAFQVVLEARE